VAPAPYFNDLEKLCPENDEFNHRVSTLATWFCESEEFKACKIYLAVKRDGFFSENIDPLGESRSAS